MHRLARYAARRRKPGRGRWPYKGKDPLHRCPQSESLCSVIHPGACSAPNGFIYRVPLQQWERGKELCVFAINKNHSRHVIIFFHFSLLIQSQGWISDCHVIDWFCLGNANQMKHVYKDGLLSSSFAFFWALAPHQSKFDEGDEWSITSITASLWKCCTLVNEREREDIENCV